MSMIAHLCERRGSLGANIVAAYVAGYYHQVVDEILSHHCGVIVFEIDLYVCMYVCMHVYMYVSC